MAAFLSRAWPEVARLWCGRTSAHDGCTRRPTNRSGGAALTRLLPWTFSMRRMLARRTDSEAGGLGVGFTAHCGGPRRNACTWRAASMSPRLTHEQAAYVVPTNGGCVARRRLRALKHPRLLAVEKQLPRIKRKLPGPISSVVTGRSSGEAGGRTTHALVRARRRARRLAIRCWASELGRQHETRRPPDLRHRARRQFPGGRRGPPWTRKTTKDHPSRDPM